MSSLPGRTLEAFLMWNYDVCVVDQDEANPSLGMAEMLGNIKPRPVLTQEQFAPLVAMFEGQRDRIEYLLNEFDEESQSWRNYANCVFDFIPEDQAQKGLAYVRETAGL